MWDASYVLDFMQSISPAPRTQLNDLNLDQIWKIRATILQTIATLFSEENHVQTLGTSGLWALRVSSSAEFRNWLYTSRLEEASRLALENMVTVVISGLGDKPSSFQFLSKEGAIPIQVRCIPDMEQKEVYVPFKLKVCNNSDDLKDEHMPDRSIKPQDMPEEMFQSLVHGVKYLDNVYDKLSVIYNFKILKGSWEYFGR